MPRTIRRQPLSVSTDTNAYPQTNIFVQAEFKGIVDTKNDVTVDQSTFSDALNVCVDDVNRLVSRPPFKFDGTAENIIKTWTFGVYRLILQKTEKHIYQVRCISHEMSTALGEPFIQIDTDVEDYAPEVFCIPIENRIFIWCEGIRIYAFNMLEEPYFEDATKYLYVPITEIVTNSVSSNYETKNFLTDAYIRRYLLSAVSEVPFEKLYGKSLRVNLRSDATQDTSSKLYDITIDRNEKSQFIYPYTNIGTDFIVDIVRTPNAFVYLRYHVVYKTIEVSFDGKSYRILPSLDNIVGKPLLTKDGMGVVVFTRNGLATCKLVAQESEDFSSENDVFEWTFRPYLEKSVENGRSIATTSIRYSNFLPIGDFETLYQFAYIIDTDTLSPSEYKPILYTEWYNADEVYCAHEVLNDKHYSKIDFEYVAPTSIATSLSPLGVIVSDSDTHTEIQGFRTKKENVDKILRSGDQFNYTVRIPDIDDPYQLKSFIYKLSTDKKFVIKDEAIQSGDNVLLSYIPLDLSSIEAKYSSTRNYRVGEMVTYNDKVYRSLINENKGKLPTDTTAWAVTDFSVYPYETNNSSYIPWHVYLLAYETELVQRVVIKNTSGDKTIRHGDTIEISSALEILEYSVDDMYAVEKLYETEHDMIIALPTPTEYYVTLYDFGPEQHTLILLKVMNSALVRLMPLKSVNKIGVSNIITKNFLLTDEEFSYEHAIFIKNTLYNLSYKINLSTDSVVQGVLSALYNTPSSVNVALLSASGSHLLTNKGLCIEGDFIPLPSNGRLSNSVPGYVQNNYYTKLLSPDAEIEQSLLPFGYIHTTKLDTGVLNTSLMKDGSYIVLNDDIISEDNVSTSSPYRIKNIYSNEGRLLFTALKDTNLVCLIDLRHTYPEAPLDWKLGDDWPTTEEWSSVPKPMYISGTVKRIWSAANKDALPTGPIAYWGYVSTQKIITPLYVDEDCVWYNINGELWSSQLGGNVIEFDEYVDAQVEQSLDDGSLIVRIEPSNVMPTHYNVLEEYYVAFDGGDKHLLEISQMRYDEQISPVRLLYLPVRNEQVFSSKITNVHPLSNTDMGIFTDTDVWYISKVSLDNTIHYTRATKSRLPIGCREGDEILTASDGQALILCTSRGITTITPQDFVATTDKMLTYLSDVISNTYDEFYQNHLFGYEPQIKIASYRYWLFFYKYMDNDILVLDTRMGTFWRWKTQYPIREMSVDSSLHVLFNIDFLDGSTKLGVPFLLEDRQPNAFGYTDDVIANTLTGEKIYTDHWIYKTASPEISWSLTSQRLHFNQIHNYKAIKGLSVNAQGDNNFKAKISTKIYRELYHPEQSTVVDIDVDDLRTFVKRFNFIHALYFQYSIQNESTNDASRVKQLRLNSLGIKYEVKERIK